MVLRSSSTEQKLYYLKVCIMPTVFCRHIWVLFQHGWTRAMGSNVYIFSLPVVHVISLQISFHYQHCGLHQAKRLTRWQELQKTQQAFGTIKKSVLRDICGLPFLISILKMLFSGFNTFFFFLFLFVFFSFKFELYILLNRVRVQLVLIMLVSDL